VESFVQKKLASLIAKRVLRLKDSPPENPVIDVMTIARNGDLAGPITVNLRGSFKLKPPEQD
jgi:hypothetical protein